MRLKFISFGKIKNTTYRSEIQRYHDRLKPFTKIEVIQLREEKVKGPGNKEHCLKTEAARLKPHLNNQDAFSILLDEAGESFSSESFAAFFGRKMNTQYQTFNFFVGSAYGFAPTVKSQANLQLSLSPFTLPHELAYVMLCEQIYRIFTIIKNIPYHHGTNL